MAVLSSVHGRAEHLPARRRGGASLSLPRAARTAARLPETGTSAATSGSTPSHRRPGTGAYRHDLARALPARGVLRRRLRQQCPRSLTHLDLAVKARKCHRPPLARGRGRLTWARMVTRDSSPPRAVLRNAPGLASASRATRRSHNARVQRLLETVLVGRAQVFSHGGAPCASPRRGAHRLDDSGVGAAPARCPSRVRLISSSLAEAFARARRTLPSPCRVCRSRTERPAPERKPAGPGEGDRLRETSIVVTLPPATVAAW